MNTVNRKYKALHALERRSRKLGSIEKAIYHYRTKDKLIADNAAAELADKNKRIAELESLLKHLSDAIAKAMLGVTR